MSIDIIMFNMSSFSEWEKGTVNRNFHILKNFSKNPRIGKILSVDFLPFTFKRVLRNYWQNIIRSPKGKIIFQDLTTKCVQISHSSLFALHSSLYIYSTIDSIFSGQL